VSGNCNSVKGEREFQAAHTFCRGCVALRGSGDSPLTAYPLLPRFPFL
jgi:hypothetical protein